MIPYLPDTSAVDAYLPPCVEQNFDFLNELTADHDSGFERLFPEISAYTDMREEDERDESDPQKLSKFLKRDCKWTGCDPECKKTHNYEDLSLDGWTSDNELLNPNSVWPVKESNEIQPYTPDSDHCYYAPASKQVKIEKEDSLDILMNIPTPPSTSDSTSETSSEDEVDVVTVPEEYHPPVASCSVEAPRRNTRSQKVLKKPQTEQLTSKSLKVAMKNATKKKGRVQNIKSRTCKRQKVQEFIPSNSNASSAQNSDVEDVEKRKSHNHSERKRREIQRTALQNLRVCIPDLQNNSKAAKVVILNSATDLINKLELNSRTLKELKYREEQRNSDLKAKLNMLLMRSKN